MALGRTLFIVNPAARHGETRKLVPAIQRTIGGVADGDIQLSAGPRHGFDMARTAEGFDTIVAVGGDGTAHEVLNGVMAHEPDVRPCFAVIPTGSGNDATLWEVAEELSCRQIAIFLNDAQGRRPVYGGIEKFQTDPHWHDLILFHEYFHGDNGAGLGASAQTGWTGLVAKLILQYGEYGADKSSDSIEREAAGHA